jgi:hypothetical protein
MTPIDEPLKPKGSIQIDELVNIDEFATFGDWVLFELNKDKFKLINQTGFIENKLNDVTDLVVVDGRSSCTVEPHRISIYQSMNLLLGKRTLEEAIARSASVTCAMLFQGDYRKKEIEPATPNFKFDTTLERLQITEQWTTFMITSELYVVPTAMGYAPAISVELQNGQLRHVLCGAKSIKEPLERLRAEHSKIVGLRISMRKLSTDRTSPYQLIASGVAPQ